MADPVRVAFDHRIFATQEYGGISRYFTRLAEHLPASGFDPRILSPLYVNAYLSSLAPGLVSGHGPIAATRVGRAIATRLGDALHAPLARMADAAIVHETYYGKRRLAPRRARVVVTVYDMIHELFPDQWVGDPTAVRKARTVAEADLILCISESTRRDLIALYPDTADRTVVTLLGFDPLPARPIPPAPSVTAPQPRPYILYVGLRGGYKNFGGLLTAFAQSPSIRGAFDILCVGGGAFSPDEVAAIDATGLRGQVRQMKASDTQLQEAYRAAALFVYPSRYEGFGIPPLEAMAAGCPVAASGTSSIPEVCGDAAEYFDPNDIGSLATAMETVLFGSTRADALRQAGTRRLARFSWQRCADDTAQAYLGVLR